jgi:hypothetical protein
LPFLSVEMGSLPRALPEDVAVATRAEIIESLQQNEALTSVISFRGQYFHVCRILRENHTLHLLLGLIGQVFGVERGTFYNQWREYKAQVQGSTQ